MTRKTLTTTTIAIILAAGPVLAQQGGMKDQSGATMDCRQMMEMQERMQSKQEQMQKELDDMVARMNTSSGEAQQTAIAELLTKLVDSRGAMQDMKQKMQPMMMGHMMKHMQSGEKGDMSDCPMMKSMQAKGHGTGSKDKDEHPGHR
ncbi:MAG: hypothetical protein R6X25_10570 [Candidatus Krumholzibacteriia bacterium]